MLGALSLVAGLCVLSGDFELNGTVIAEVRGGEAPLVVGQPPVAGVVGIVTPRAELDYRESNLGLRLDYGPRVFYRQPNEQKNHKPLVLHSAGLSLSTRATSTLTVTGGLGASYGQVDYTSLSTVISTSTTAQPALAALPDIFTASARGSAQLAASRLVTLGLGVDTEYRRPVGTVAPSEKAGAGISLAEQVSVRVDPTGAVKLTTLDDLLLASSVQYQAFASIPGVVDPMTMLQTSAPIPPSEFFIVTPEVGWRRRLATRTSFSVMGGAAFLRATGTTASPFNPVGSAQIEGTSIWARDRVLQTSFGVAADYFVDPVLKDAEPRGVATARSIFTFAPEWTAGIEATFITSLTSKVPVLPGTTTTPPSGTAPAQPIDTTVASVALPVGHRISKNYVIEFGGRWSDRGPNLWDSGFAFHQRQLWIFVSLMATTREIPRQTIR